MQFLKVVIQKTFEKFIADQLDSLAEQRRDALPLDYLEGIVEVIDYSFIVLVVVGPRVAVVALVVDIAHGLGSVAGDDERRGVVWQAGSIWQCDDLVIIDHVDVFLFNLGIAARVSRFKLQIGIDECLEQAKYCEIAGVPELPAEEGDNPLHFLIEVALLGQQPEMLLYTFAVPLQELAVPEPAQEVHEAVDIHPPALVGIDCPKRWSALFFHSRIYIYTNLILAEVGRGIYNFNMDYFLIFRFEVLEGAENAGRLESLEAELVRQEEEKYGGSSKMQFTNLTFATNFRQAMLAILKKMQDINNNFVNIQLVCEDTSLFTHILPAEFSARSLAMPYCLTNFVDWRAVCREKYGCVSRTLQETAKFLNLMELSDADVILKLLLRKLRQEKAIVDTEVAFVRRFESKQVASENFAYFRCIGLPFQISKNELVQRMIEPQRFNIKNYGLSLIFEHGKFSGKAVLKVPAEFAEMVLRKDRMYIGRRYVQISTIGRQDFEGYKMREQRQRQESRGREARPERSSSSSQSRSRSREKLEIHSLLNEAAVKVRGLPYSLNSWDIEQIFKRFNFVRGSIKLGFLGQRKSGEAVILFPNREEAERAMHLQGFVVQGRYLELKVITKQNYDRFK